MFLLPLGLDVLPANSYENFMREIHEAYSLYEVSDKSVSNDKFELTIIAGLNKNEMCYGFYFSSKEANKYQAVLRVNGVNYSMPENSNLDNYAHSLSGLYDIEVIIYDNNGKKEGTDIYLPKLLLQNLKNPKAGNSVGTNETMLSQTSMRMPFFSILIFVLLAVIISSVVIILVFYFTKKGMFARETRKNGVINMRELVKEQTFEQQPKEENYFDDLKSETVEEKEANIDDVKAYLQDKGFVTDYKLLSEEEKNKIMIELIALKNKGLISMETYYDETCELWKK